MGGEMTGSSEVAASGSEKRREIVGDHEELVIAWLWSDKQGVFSHQTALALHGLSDALPSKAHILLPATWRARRLRVPADVIVRFKQA